MSKNKWSLREKKNENASEEIKLQKSNGQSIVYETFKKETKLTLKK